jgi:hypothetical protein
MNGLIACDAMEIDIEVLTTTREGGVIGSFEIDLHQGQDRSQKSLYLAKRESENETQCQGGLDCVIGELPLGTPSAGRCRFPRHDYSEASLPPLRDP